METERYKTDVLIIGGGGAGVRAAIEAADRGCSVLICTKGAVARSGSTPMAYPAINAALDTEGDGDSPEQHFRDLVAGGRGLSDEDLAQALAADSPARIADLQDFGVEFERNADGSLAQIRHPGHTKVRTLTIRSGGAGMIRGLRSAMLKRERIHTAEDMFVLTLLKKEGRVIGAAALDKRSGALSVIHAGAVIIASGGYEAMWQHTDVSPDVTGDGLMLAYRAGAALIDLEMILYYPFVGCGQKGRGIMLQYESLVHPQRFGGKLLDARGNDLLGGMLPPPRDEMLRIIENAVAAGNAGPNGGVFLDLTGTGLSKEKRDALIRRYFNFPPENLKLQGIDFDAGPIEVKPGLHYSLGGIRINAACETTLPGLFAAGECASNLHGSNRLSGNALAETQVFGCRAGKNAAAFARSNPPEQDERTANAAIAEQEALLAELHAPCDAPVSPAELKAQLRAVMESHVGAKRCAEGLAEADTMLGRLEEELKDLRVTDTHAVFNNEVCAAIEVRSMISLARLIARSAAFRRETRGHHIRTDYPAAAARVMHTRVRAGQPVDEIPVVKIK